jgi:hypothetical protein
LVCFISAAADFDFEMAALNQGCDRHLNRPAGDTSIAGKPFYGWPRAPVPSVEVPAENYREPSRRSRQI